MNMKDFNSSFLEFLFCVMVQIHIQNSYAVHHFENDGIINQSSFLTFQEKIKKTKLSHLTILPLGVLKGHADEYSKPVPGSITGCSPITPLPLHKGIMISLLKNKNKNRLSSWSNTRKLKMNELYDDFKRSKTVYNKIPTRHSQLFHWHQ